MPRTARYIIAAALTSTALTLPARAEVPQVVTDIPPVQSLVAAVMGDLGQPQVVLDQGASVHDFQLRPSQVRALAGADLVIWVGPELTPWMVKSLEQRGADAAVLGLLADAGTARLDYAAPHDHGDAHEHEDDHDHGDDHAGHDHGDDHAGHSHDGTDPHAWLDPENGLHWVELIRAELSRLDPDNAATYAANAAAAAAAIRAADDSARAALAPHGDSAFAVFHDAYGYFTGHYGLHPAHAIALGDAAAPGARRLSDLRAEIEADQIRCIFPESGHDPALVTQLAEGTTARIGAELDPEGRQMAAGPGLYPAIIAGMADTIATCLNG